jgi:transcriptional regulator of acetoin/glycerol metabolism
VVAATNRDLLAEVRAGRFREDLFPPAGGGARAALPLRRTARRHPQLALSDPGARRRSRPASPRIPPETMEMLKAHDWPGNVRELRNVLERASSLAPGAAVVDERLLGFDDPRLSASISSPPFEWRP